jgi:hypothetical protein
MGKQTKHIRRSKKGRKFLAGRGKNVHQLIAQYIKLENMIIDKLSKLENYGGDCDCGMEDREVFSYIHEGNWKEIMILCTKCGGSVEEMENI